MRFSEDRIEKLSCSDGIERDIHIWEPKQPRAVFLTIHGGMDHGGNYIFPALFLKKHNMATVAHDQQGHDKQQKVYIPRFEVFLDDVDLMIKWMKVQYPGIPIFVLAHSMGGLIATHFGIKRLKEDPQIKGFIMSSPYYVNAVKAPWLVLKVAGLLSALVPKMAVPIEDVVPHVTHDSAVYDRHREDARDHIKADKVSSRFANELLRAQSWIPGNIHRWNHQLLAIIAGDDKLANSVEGRKLLGQIEPDLITELFYPENYHENFNELNRNEIFGEIVKWVEPRI